MVGIKVKLDDKAKKLFKKHPEDAGWDIYATEKVTVTQTFTWPPGEEPFKVEKNNSSDNITLTKYYDEYRHLEPKEESLIEGTTNPTTDETHLVYHTGVYVSIPKGYVGLIFPRSSIYKKDLLLHNSVGVIDSGYTGEIKFIFMPTGWKEYEIGDRIGQIIFMKLPEVQLEYVDSLEETARGEGGFGSTGA